MFEQMKWENAYKLWNDGLYYFPRILSEPVIAEPVFVKYDRNGYIYGYDWIQKDEAQERKELIAKSPAEFLYFTKPSNKGTIRTVQMLAEAKDEEERAAVWIAATAFELMETHLGEGIPRYAQELYYAAVGFLRERYGLWHHAMRRLVPEIMIPYTVLDSIQCDRTETVMGLIQINVMLLKGSYTPLLYSSINEEEAEYKERIALHSLRF